MDVVSGPGNVRRVRTARRRREEKELSKSKVGRKKSQNLNLNMRGKSHGVPGAFVRRQPQCSSLSGRTKGCHYLLLVRAVREYVPAFDSEEKKGLFSLFFSLFAPASFFNLPVAESQNRSGGLLVNTPPLFIKIRNDAHHHYCCHSLVRTIPCH